MRTTETEGEETSHTVSSLVVYCVLGCVALDTVYERETETETEDKEVSYERTE